MSLIPKLRMRSTFFAHPACDVPNTNTTLPPFRLGPRAIRQHPPLIRKDSVSPDFGRDLPCCLDGRNFASSLESQIWSFHHPAKRRSELGGFVGRECTSGGPWQRFALYPFIALPRIAFSRERSAGSASSEHNGDSDP